MFRKKSKYAVVLAIVVLIGAFIGAIVLRPRLDTKHFIQSTTPTLFFHGYGSSANAQTHMTQAAKQSGVTNTIIRAEVDEYGAVTLMGKIPKGAINPIVEVNYQDNRNADYHQDARYAKAVVTKLQSTYGFTKMNMVGHSMGNMSILFYLLDNAHEKDLPQVQKQVHIANHVNGLEGRDLPERHRVDEVTGQPEEMSASYQQLLALREQYPNQQIDVLNIYGDVKDESDGSVLNASSKSLKYLLLDRAKSYREEKMTGKLAQHSQLHENPAVDALLIEFLWGNYSELNTGSKG
ncbi:alpha/beta hydrolase [Streptococcus respiraculi]|uniref:alpha/beta hydrolase n=1 Tax=Streptococcus respiraculi TaxID=2021971 RepID=UPI000E716126|nr:alpha/beta hydrolase [Streptococcus respiraculi]